ncbi:MAG: hypothetical protein J5725_08700 [Bacteroidales bacterium]|nr:hypothetical protein [Bacteroidales bacterium]
MRTITLYTGGGVSLSPVYADGRTVSNYVRLVADDGKMLTNGERELFCADVLAADVGNWTEIAAPIEDDDIPDDEALSILLGGEE